MTRHDAARWEATTKDFDYRQEDCVDPEKFIWPGLMGDGNTDHSWRGSRAQSGRTPQAGRFAAAGKRTRSYKTQLKEVVALNSRIPVRSVTVA